MKAEIRYLARLTRRPAGHAMLLPPRRLFTGDIEVVPRQPDRGAPARRRKLNVAESIAASLPPAAGEDPVAQETIAPGPGADTGQQRLTRREPEAVAVAEPAHTPGTTVTPGTSIEPPRRPSLPAAPVVSGWQEPASGIPGPPDGADVHSPPQSASHEPGPSAPGLRQSGAADLADGFGDYPVALPAAPRAESIEQSAGYAEIARAAGSTASPHRDPVDPPAVIDLAPAAAEPGSHQHWRADDAGATRYSGGHESAADSAWPPDPDAVSDLMPAHSSSPRPVATPTAAPDARYREPRPPRHPQVSIGSIEVTVVPPAPPAPPARPAPADRTIQPPAPAAHGASGAAPLLASSAGGERLRNGVRRWYGTAQG